MASQAPDFSDDGAAVGVSDAPDRLVEDLRGLRALAGDVSYAEIAARIARRRESRGATPVAARVAPSTVYDAFRPGRRRINAGLVGEIVIALGGTEDEAAQWRQRCAASKTAPQSRTRTTPVPERDETAAVPWRAAPGFAVMLVVACVGVDFLGGTLDEKLHLPLYLDMIGTAIAAFMLGPWQGALVGVLLNVIGGVTAGPDTMWFGLVNIAGGLVWGYGVRAWRMRRPGWRFLLLNVLVAVACSFVAVPINVLVFGNGSGNASDGFIGAFQTLGAGLWPAVFSVNMVVSLADKLISGYLALGATAFLDRLHDQPARERQGKVLDATRDQTGTAQSRIARLG